MLSGQIKKSVKHSKKFIKFKLLLDESLSLPDKYPSLNEHYNLKHLSTDFKTLRGSTDQRVYELAEKEQRIMVVVNTKDFKPLIKKNKPSIILLSSKLSNKDADLKICKVLKQLSLKQAKGCLISITNSSNIIKLPE